MVAVERFVRFYVDESAAGLGLALAAARKDTIHVGHRLIPECPRGALDPDWIPAVAARGLIVITRDTSFGPNPSRSRRCGKTGCGCSTSEARKTYPRGTGSRAWYGTADVRRNVCTLASKMRKSGNLGTRRRLSAIVIYWGTATLLVTLHIRLRRIGPLNADL